MICQNLLLTSLLLTFFLSLQQIIHSTIYGGHFISRSIDAIQKC